MQKTELSQETSEKVFDNQTQSEERITEHLRKKFLPKEDAVSEKPKKKELSLFIVIQSNEHQTGFTSLFSSSFRFDNLSAVVHSAGIAHLMSKFVFAAVRAFYNCRFA